MTIRDALNHAPIVSLDAELLLSFILGNDRAWILAHDCEELHESHRRSWEKLVSRRIKGEPVAYITGTKEFYGRMFDVSPAVLIPRPSTEKLIEVALDFLQSPALVTSEADSGITVIAVPLSKEKPVLIADIGTGSGIIPLTLRLEGRREEMVGIDISSDALEIAKKNMARHQISDITWVESDGIEWIKSCQKPFLAISNPPYIPEKEKLPSDVADFEPHQALFAGKRGLRTLLPLAKAAKENPVCTGVLFELRMDQLDVVHGILSP